MIEGICGGVVCFRVGGVIEDFLVVGLLIFVFVVGGVINCLKVFVGIDNGKRSIVERNYVEYFINCIFLFGVD